MPSNGTSNSSSLTVVIGGVALNASGNDYRAITLGTTVKAALVNP